MGVAPTSDDMQRWPAAAVDADGLVHFRYNISPIAVTDFARTPPGSQGYDQDFVFLASYVVPHTVTLTGIVVYHAAVIVGQLRVGIYGPDPAPYTIPDGLPLIDESAAVAAGPANQAQLIPLQGGDQQLAPGMYWVCIIISATGDEYEYVAGDVPERTPPNTVALHRFYAQAFGPFTDPCPATDDWANCPLMHIRIVSTP